jgi:hypothetical protein
MPREESISTLTERLAALIGTVDQALWTVDRVLEELGPGVSADACEDVLRRLEHAGEVKQVAPGLWRRDRPRRSTQADWHA